jgi:ribosome-associated toxin RatA of RatAB toxin-antitoxin module
MAFSVKDSIDVEASAEDVFEVATDFESYPEWNGAMKKVEVKEQDDEGRATKVFFEVDARLKTVRYTLSYDYANAPESFSWSLVDGDVKKLHGAYSFDEFDDVTEVSYELELDPGFPVPGIFRRQGERELKKAALDELKNRVESRG